MVKKVPRFTLAISITLPNTRCPPTALYKNTIKTLPNRMAASGTFKRELLKSKYWRSANCSLDFDWRRRREGRMSFKAAWKIQIKLPFIFSVDLVLKETSRIPALLLRYYAFKLFNKASETIKLPCVYTKLRCNGFHAGYTLQIFPEVIPHICMSHVSCFPALGTGCIFFPRLIMLHVFQRLVPVTYFFCASYQLHILPALGTGCIFWPPLVLVECFPAPGAYH